MAQIFNMPKLGMDMEEGTIIRWLKKKGDVVKAGEPVAEIETDKAAMEVEAPCAGVILEIYHQDGDTVRVNLPIAAFGVQSEKAPKADTADTAVVQAEEGKQDAVFETKIPPLSQTCGSKMRVSPRAKRLAAKENIDLKMLSGSGPAGRIVERDVKAWIEHRREPEPAGARGEKVIPLVGIRKVIATRMKQSLQEMAQANHRMDVDASNLIEFRRQINLHKEFSAMKASISDILVAACSKALLDFPEANSTMKSDGIHLLKDVNIGIAVATDRGLVVPVLHHAHEMSLKEISERSRYLIKKAQDGGLVPDEMTGGTFTVTNLGMYDVDSFTAIVNSPEAAILAVGKIADRVVPAAGKIGIRPYLTLSLSYDHRILDGVPAAKFLSDIKKYIENPALILLKN